MNINRCQKMRGIFVGMLLLTQITFAQHPISLVRTSFRSERIVVPGYHTSIQIPLELVNGIPLVEAKLNQILGKYILDTGAPMLLINQIPMQNLDIQAQGINGTFKGGAVKVTDFEWHTQRQKQMIAVAADLTHIERAIKRPIAGIIGYDLLKNSELLLDYAGGQLALLDPRKNELHRTASPLLVVPFTMQEHLPVIEVQVEGRTLRLVLDTGAGINLLDEACAQQFSATTLYCLGQEQLQGISPNVEQGTSVRVAGAMIGQQSLPEMKFLLSNLTQFNTKIGVPVDGLLGYSFFKQVKCSIHYSEQKFYIWSWQNTIQ